MKKTLVINLWLMIVAWCMFLNGYVFVSVLITLSAAACSFCRAGEVLCLKNAALSALFAAVSICLCHISNIPFFFPGLQAFLIAVTINAGIFGGCLNRMKRRQMQPLLLAALTAFILFNLLIAVVPEESYSLFGKWNLFLMVSFIFLPYLLPMMVCYVHRYAVLYRRAQLMIKERASL